MDQVRQVAQARWSRVGPKHVSRCSGYRLEVFLKPELRENATAAFDDVWGWKFMVLEYDGTEVVRGVRESREDAMDAAVQKANNAIPPHALGWGEAFAS